MHATEPFFLFVSDEYPGSHKTSSTPPQGIHATSGSLSISIRVLQREGTLVGCSGSSQPAHVFKGAINQRAV